MAFLLRLFIDQPNANASFHGAAYGLVNSAADDPRGAARLMSLVGGGTFAT